MRVVASFLVAALLATTLATPAAAAPAGLLTLDVGLAEGADPAAVVAASGVEVRAAKPIAGLSAMTVDVPADSATAALRALAAHPDVRYAEHGALLHADGDPHDGANRHKFEAMTIPQARTWTTGRPEVTVAVLDTGVSANPDLPAERLVAGRDVVDADADASDDDGHGTMVANLIAAEAGNGVGTTGVCSGCRIMPVRVLQHRDGLAAQGTSADVAAGIVWAADHGAQIINLSLSTVTHSSLLEEAVQHAIDKGVLVVAAAGNEPGTHRRYPAALDSVLSVGAIGTGATNDEDDEWIALQAYTGFTVLDARGEPRTFAGTSAAAAVVSGVAGLAMSLHQDTFMEQVSFLIARGAQHPEHPGLRAARVLVDLGAEDTVAPTVTFETVPSGRAVVQSVEVRPSAVDDHAVDRVELLVNDEVVAADQGFPHLVGSLQWRPAAGFTGTVSVTVRAYDYRGNWAVAPAATVRVDNVAPTATIVSPAAGAYVRSPTEVVVDTPEERPAAVTANGVPMTRVPGTRRWKANVPAANGALQVVVTDEAGLAVTLRRSVVVDAAGPTARAVGPAQNARVRGTFASTLSSVADGAGVAKVELWANGKYVGADPAAPYSLPVKTGSLSGNVDLRWRLTDKLGNTRDYLRRVVADNRRPSVSITNAPKHKAKVNGAVKVHVAASDASGVARVELVVNGKVVARDATAAYVLGVNTAKQAKTMTVYARAYDKLGNVTSTATRVWYRK